MGGHTSIPHEAHERARAHFMPSSPAESPARARAARNQDSVRKLDWQRRVPRAPAEEAAQFGSSRAMQRQLAGDAPEYTGRRPAASPEHDRPRCGDGRPAWDDSTATSPARRALFAGGSTGGGSSASLQRPGGAERQPRGSASSSSQSLRSCVGQLSSAQLGKALGAPGATSTRHGAGRVCGTGACSTGACSTPASAALQLAASPPTDYDDLHGMFRPYERCAPSDIILGASVPRLQPSSSSAAQGLPRHPPRPATAPLTPSRPPPHASGGCGRGSPSSGYLPLGRRPEAEWLPGDGHHHHHHHHHGGGGGVRAATECVPRGTLGGTATGSAAARVDSSAYDFEWGEPDYDFSWGEPEPTEVMFGDPMLRLAQLAQVERCVPCYSRPTLTTHHSPLTHSPLTTHHSPLTIQP